MIAGRLLRAGPWTTTIQPPVKMPTSKAGVQTFPVKRQFSVLGFDGHIQPVTATQL